MLHVNIVDFRVTCIQQRKSSYAVWFDQDLLGCLATMDQMESQELQDKRENQE